jgi:Flp pilus assembly protein CpaB
MRPIKPNMRRRSTWRSVLLALGAIAIGGAGTVAVLGATNVIDLGRLAFWREKANPIPPGWIAVPVSARPIPAYASVTRDYLLDPKTGTWAWQPMKQEQAKGVITDLAKIKGRVTKHEMPATAAFSESDLLPVGTRPGISAGVPLGKRAYTFNANSLDGCVYQVKEGDHVDLMVSIPVNMPGAGGSGPAGTSVLATPDTLIRPTRTLEIPLVQDGVVVSPVTVRNTPSTSSSLMNGTNTRNVRVEEIVIAVAPAEVAPLDEAKALKHKLTCVARSGLPEPPPAAAAPPSATGTAAGGISQVAAAPGKALPSKQPSAAAADKASPSPERAKTANPTKGESPAKDRVAMDITPGLNPMADVRYMEVMIGPTRRFILFNGPGNSPVVLSQVDGADKSGAATAPQAAPAGAAPASDAAVPDESEE